MVVGYCGGWAAMRLMADSDLASTWAAMVAVEAWCEP